MKNSNIYNDRFKSKVVYEKESHSNYYNKLINWINHDHHKKH
jgi:hypothetical protein